MSRAFVYLVVTQIPYDGFVQQELDILRVIQNFNVGRATLCLTTMFGFTRIDTLDDAETTEIVQRQLQFSQSLTTCNIMGTLSGFVLLIKKTF